MKVIVRTELWNTPEGQVTKAVVRDTKGKFLGATNQTKAVKADANRLVIVGK